MQVQTIVKLIFPTEEKAKIFYDSFMPDFPHLPTKRTKLRIYPSQQRPQEIHIDIQSEDATAFRATINSIIQFARTVEVTVGLVEGTLPSEDEET